MGNLHLKETRAMLVKPDFDTVQKGLRWLAPRPNQVFEIRTIKNYTNQCAVGYFNDTIIAANSITNSDNGGIAGTYVTLNPVVPELFARVSNRMVDAKAGAFTNDKEIIERRGLLLDFDPKRVSGISSSDEEHEATLQYMLEVTADLQTFHGFPSPCLIDSGNGGHGRYITESLPNDDDTKELFKVFLQCMAARYDTPTINIDKSVFNASRITRVPGTPARKGENNVDRPHRVSKIIQHVDPFDILHRGVIERFVNLYRHLIVERPKRALGAPTGDYPDDEKLYRTLNRTSKDRYHDWVPHLLGTVARKSGTAYRISSDNIGRDLEEDILIDEMGIKDFGVHDMGDGREGRRTAVSLLSELVFEGNKRKAAEALATCLDTDINEFEGKLIRPPLPVDIHGEPITMPSALMGSPLQFAAPKSYKDINILTLKGLTWMVEDFILDRHYTLVTAPTKVGKSTLSRMLVASMLTGLDFLGRKVPMGDVLYIAYEDMQDDLWKDVRNNIMLLIAEAGYDPMHGEGFAMREAALNRFHTYAEQNGEVDFFKRVPRGKPGLDFLRDEIKNHPNVKLVIVDPIRFLRDETIRSRNIVDQEYYEGLDFKGFASETGVSVMGLHHSNKESGKKSAEGDDPATAAGGTAAIGGAPGNVIVFRGDRVPEGIEGHIGLYKLSRIGQPKTIMVQPVRGRFYLSPPGSEIFYMRKLTAGGGNGQRGRPTDKPSGAQADALIIAYLEKTGTATISNIADGIDIPKYTVNSRAEILVAQGVLKRLEDRATGFKTTPGPKPYLYSLTEKARLPD